MAEIQGEVFLRKKCVAWVVHGGRRKKVGDVISVGDVVDPTNPTNNVSLPLKIRRRQI